MTADNMQKLEAFMEDKNNWRPPSLSQVAKFMGWKSKASAKRALIQLRVKKGQPISVNEARILKKLPVIKNAIHAQL